jgi:hypothetical protein
MANNKYCVFLEMLRRTTFLVSALCLLILANVLMMSFASPAFTATGEGFVNHMQKLENMEDEEEFRNYSGNPAGSRASYEPMGAFDNVKLETGNGSDWRYTRPNEPLNGPEVEVGPDNLFMFKNNQCKPECCGASFSCDGGCVCTSPQQRDLINTRGGNRVMSGDF